MNVSFSIILSLVVTILVKEDNYIWGLITFIISLFLLVLDDKINYFKYDYKG